MAGENAARVAALVTDLWLPADHTLYRVGEPAEEHYFVVDGEIEVTAPGGGRWTFGARSIVGILDVAQERPRSRSARTLRDTHVLRLRAADWHDFLEDDFEFARGAIHNISRGLMLLHLTAQGRGFETKAHVPVRARPGPLSFVDRTLLLRSVPPFQRASVQATVDLIPHARLRELGGGDLLFESGAPRETLYVVAGGAVTVLKDTWSATFEVGTLVGGLGSLSPDPWVLRARAAEAGARVLEIDTEDLFDAMEEHFDLVRGAIAELSREREAIQAFELQDLPNAV